MRRGDDRVLLAVLLRAQELLAEVVVDRRVGAAADRAGEGERGGARAVAADEQLGARADEGGVAAGRRSRRSRSRSRRAARRRPRPGRAAREAVTWTSRASTTFSSSPARMRSTARATASS